MKMNNDFAPVVKSSASLETAQASVAMTPHMFQILSSGIYQHKERAVIRELSANAKDTQIEAGNPDQPFDVHLPNKLEPYFEVRDYGTGMTHDQVMSLYLTYGASTKRDTDDAIGGLGIGSKSPFAIAQSFAVTSYKDGTVRRYTIYMEEGIPQVTKLTETPTTEPNGVAVRVAVSLDKIDKFLEEAARIYEHFPIKPNLNREIASIYGHLPILAEEKDEFRIYSGRNNSNQVSAGIVMGNIEYPINLWDIFSNLDDVIPPFLRHSIQHALIYLPIGAVNIAASRESLQLTDGTKDVIAGIFSKVSDKILKSFQDKVDAETTLFGAIKAFNQAVGTEGNANNIPVLRKKVTFQGKLLSDWLDEQLQARVEMVLDEAGVPALDKNGRQIYKDKFAPITRYRTVILESGSAKRLEGENWNSAIRFSMFHEMTPEKLESDIFIIEDRYSKTGSIKTIGRKQILSAISKEARSGNVYPTWAYMFNSQAELDQLIAAHHYPVDKMRIFKMSDYESSYVPNKIVRGQVKIWKSTNGNGMVEEKVDLDSIEDAQYYIKAEGHTIFSESLRQGDEMPVMMRRLSEMFGEVFLFRKATWGKIPEDWIEITADVIAQQIKKHPEWWINLNQSFAAREAHNKERFHCESMKVLVRMKHAGRVIRDGYHYHYNGDETVNFEDNLDVLTEMFGRPPLVFANILYSDLRNQTALLWKVKDFLIDCKLKQQIIAAEKRARANVTAERKKAAKKGQNQLLSWVDWNKVSLRQIAKYLGHEMTPFIDRTQVAL
ncbi:hypothetical protein [Pectobacterium phage Wc4-1]|uniref:RIIA-like protein n=1 Tax=Pectobacterium phage Wc4 TaxID=2652428 RepID=A0A5P8D417_9CAUD|nr:hypothetical protein [Pectobacterium phage Wc4]QFP93951.1 hypothetical protein [Pectobacterium phage Wc4-1]